MNKLDYEKLVAKAIADGWKRDLSESVSLERAGLLLTDRVRVDIAVTAIMRIADLLDETTIQQIVPPGGLLNALDVKRFIAGWLREHAQRNLDALEGRS